MFLGFKSVGLLSEKIVKIIANVTAPETRRINVKLAASIACVPSAKRQRIELNAKATSAKIVSRNIFKSFFLTQGRKDAKTQRE